MIPGCKRILQGQHASKAAGGTSEQVIGMWITVMGLAIKGEGKASEAGALEDLQSTEALDCSQLDTTDLATESASCVTAMASGYTCKGVDEAICCHASTMLASTHCAHLLTVSNTLTQLPNSVEVC